ncbi:PREDICTED: uncharacterized protein LOC108781997 [Cyphomyrmex costatus]|uniref:uncharacterized protein LOC108781997 n=1 Tax=Cyphomyrmex costatus TaxID=456900 RepID=UPI0008522872|nr:PREDICTED: uncharacterized protein LOC108781997 [Cyphomyrmex costatus]
MSESSELRRMRGYIKAKLTRLRSRATQTSEASIELNKEQAEARLEKLEEVYNEFVSIQKQLLEKSGELSDDDAFEEECFEERYFEVKSILKEFIRQKLVVDPAPPNADEVTRLLQQQTELMQQMRFDGRGEGSTTAMPRSDNESLAAILARQTDILDRVANVAGIANVDNRVKLPTIKLPRFDGKIEEWKSFSDSFRSIIHDRSQLSNVEKFQYLISAISGDAAKIIESIQLTGQNYSTAWELLQNRYDDPRSLKKKHIECLFKMPVIAKESAKALRELIDYTSRHLRMLRILGLPTESWDDLVMHMMEDKFDTKTLRAWEEETKSSETVNLNDMLEFLKNRSLILERIKSRAATKTEKPLKGQEQHIKGSQTHSKSQSVSKGIANQKTSSLTASLNFGKCYLCDGLHFLYTCEKFLALTVDDRIKEVKRLKLCINCLKNDHFVRSCKMGHCKECTKKHNTLCHLPRVDNDLAKAGSQDDANQLVTNVALNQSLHKVKRRRILMATAIMEATRRDGSRISIRVLLDSASEANFLTQAAYNKLGLKRNKAFEVVTGLNEVENKIYNICEVHVLSKCSNFEASVQCLIVPKITKNLPSVEIDRDKLKIPGNIALADSEFHKNGPIDLLLGAEFFFDILEVGKIDLGKDELVLQNTRLEWIIAGTVPMTACKISIDEGRAISTLTCLVECSHTLSERLEKFWKLENYDSDTSRALSANDKKCEQYFEQTVTRTSSGKFVVKLPFRDANLPIGDNREIAFKRLMHLENRFKRDDIMLERYVKFMREYIDLGHVSIVKPTLGECKGAVYLPHHGVLKESSSSTKLRVVFDASAKNNKGVSLNDALLIGPVLQDNLIDIVIRFRTYKIALTADLQKMYRQVLVHENDRDFQRILWRFSLEDSIEEYRLNIVTYGQACASYIAVRCLRQLAVEGEERYPLASHTLLHNTYVDDIISGSDTTESVQVLQEQLTALLRQGGFEAHKWCSNSVSSLEGVPFELREPNSSFEIDANDTIRTLGLEWNPSLDKFQFTIQAICNASTKREILSAITKLFDPLGLIGPILTVAKILMQSLWETKVGWDDPLPDAILDKWKEFRDSLKNAHKLCVPRLVIGVSDDCVYSMFGFCDASEHAYGACVYIPSVSPSSQETTVKLLCAKARVAPLKRQSIPRLELCSALLLAKLIDNVKRAIHMEINEIRAWSVVLASRRFNTLETLCF